MLLPRSLHSSLVSKKRIATRRTETFERQSKGIVGSRSVLRSQSDKVIEAADVMMPTIAAGIQAKLTEDYFNVGYKMY